jgi:lipopolysaccharide export system permease protein
MRASGVSIYRILIPFLLGGVLLASGQLVLQDQLVPWAKRAAQTLEERFLGHENPAQADMDDVWLKSDRMLIHVHQVIPSERVMLDVAVFEWDGSERLLNHIQARSARMRDGQWLLIQGILHHYGEGAVTAEKFAQRNWPIALTPEQLNRTAVNPDFLPFEQIHRLIERTEREGYDATHLRVLLHSRISHPTTTLAAILLAFPFTLRLPRRGGVTRSLLLGLLIGFLMFVVADLSQALGMGGRLPPVLAAWAPVLFFAGLGGFLFLHLADPKRQG